MSEITDHNITWENIDISIVFKPDYFASAGVSHLAVQAGEPLPFTPTGFKSIWIMKGELDGTTEVQHVLDALDHDSNTKKWKDYLAQKAIDDMAKTQLSLF